MIRRSLPVLLASLALLGVAGCSSGGDDTATTTSNPPATTTTTTKPEITDEEIIDNINAKLRPALEDAFDAKTVDCVIGVLEDGGTGKLNADQVVPAYEERCGVTATRVTGVITGATLVDQGATPEQGLCVADAVAKLTYDEVTALDEGGTNALYEACGIDVDALVSGG